MSKLATLISELCPNGVPFEPLSVLFFTKNGYTPSKSQSDYWENGTVPWFRMEDIRENGHILFDSLQHVNKKAVKGELFPANSIIVSTSATIGQHALITVPSLANQRFTYLVLKEEWKGKFVIRFLFYYCYLLDDWCLNHLKQGSFASVDMKQFAAFSFPVPPLEVQAEIVRILDNFTEVTAELTTELTAELTTRKQQYSFYRNRVLEQVNDAQALLLKDVCEIYDGTHQTPKYEESGVKFVSVENIDDLYGTQKYISEKDYDNYKAKPQINDLFMTRITAGIIGRCTVVNQEEPLAYYVSLALLRPNQSVLNSRYLKCYLESIFGRRELNKYILWDATPTKINKQDIGKIKIILPSLEVQNAIVERLNSFEAACSQMNSGLLAEIEARQKQYAYYRDKLLSFSELT